MEEEGIFRVNGNARVIEKLKESFEKHGDADLESSEDIFAVAGLLKLFLRELPESVIPESMTSKFVHCQEGMALTLVRLCSQTPDGGGSWWCPLSNTPTCLISSLST